MKRLTENEKKFLEYYCNLKNKMESLINYAYDIYDIDIRYMYNKFKENKTIKKNIICECCGKKYSRGYYYAHKRTNIYKQNIEKQHKN
jgi:hypothetical protein